MPIWPFRKRPSPQQNREVVASILVGAGFEGVPNAPEDNYFAYAREAYGRLPLIYACTQEIATSSAEARLRVVKSDGAALDRGPLAAILRQPNPGMDQFAFVEALNIYLSVAGNAYVFKSRGRAGQIVAWYLLRPDRVEVVPGPEGPLGYLYTVNGVPYPIGSADLGHIKLFNPFDDYYGLSPLHVLAKTMMSGRAQADFVTSFFNNAAIPSGLLKVRRKLADQQEADKIREKFTARFGGRANWHRLPVLDEDADYQQLSSNLEDLVMPELHQITEALICEVFGVPPILVGATAGLEHSTYANYGEARASFWEETLLPRNQRIIGALRSTFADDYDELATGAVLEWDYGEVRALQENEDEKSKRVVEQFKAGLVRRDEARETLGMDPLGGDDGEAFYVAPNVRFTGEGIVEPEPPAAPAPPDEVDGEVDGAGQEAVAAARRNGHTKIEVLA